VEAAASKDESRRPPHWMAHRVQVGRVGESEGGREGGREGRWMRGPEGGFKDGGCVCGILTRARRGQCPFPLPSSLPPSLRPFLPPSLPPSGRWRSSSRTSRTRPSPSSSSS